MRPEFSHERLPQPAKKGNNFNRFNQIKWSGSCDILHFIFIGRIISFLKPTNVSFIALGGKSVTTVYKCEEKDNQKKMNVSKLFSNHVRCIN